MDGKAEPRMNAPDLIRNSKSNVPAASAVAPGYHGGFLAVDATTGQAQRRPIPERVLRRYLGGSGLGAWLLLAARRPGLGSAVRRRAACAGLQSPGRQPAHDVRQVRGRVAQPAHGDAQ